MMKEVTHGSKGIPLESYELTREDHRRQKQCEDTHEAVERMFKENPPPPLSDHQTARLRELLQPQPDYEIMRWRVRLYCGHVVETSRHCENDKPTNHGSVSMRCPQCAMDPAHIVAYEPIGLRGEPSQPVKQPKQPSKATLQRRLKKLEAEAEELRQQLRRYGA
ncbi:hypothetical protein [Mycobacterium sp. 852002-40037_SCH5390672]|uniref:hypothetical protein n=1 Tax=Mycobacterium sp. 852002-40037_SCH5390672 TaxID=1834089 RepID=UPI0012E753C2|nr:hypothetical protein [Mycobacterium sp. 852002-40037_SCH5390672]